MHFIRSSFHDGSDELKIYKSHNQRACCLQQIPNSWNANVCFNFCDMFLQYVKDTVQLDYDR